MAKLFDLYKSLPAATLTESSQSKDHFITNIEKDTTANKYYRKVIYTAKNLQLVYMSIPPNGDIGEEVHPKTDQFIRVEKGKGKAVFNGKEKSISDGSAFVIPQGTTHNIINTGNVDLKVYTLYSPPHHQMNTVRKTKEDADKHKEHFDGKTDV